MKRILTATLALWLALTPASFGDDTPFSKAQRHLRPFGPGIFHCNGVPVVMLSKGFWVLRDWQCPHYGFFYPRGFYQFAYPYCYSLPYGPTGMYGVGPYPGYYPHPYTYGIYPPYLGYLGDEREEPWYKFIQKYLKEHPEQEGRK